MEVYNLISLRGNDEMGLQMDLVPLSTLHELETNFQTKKRARKYLRSNNGLQVEKLFMHKKQKEGLYAVGM